MAFITDDIIPLNRTEFGYAAIEGLAAGVMQPYILRFNAPLDKALVRRVLRQLVSNYPKLRAMLEAGPHRYHFRVLPDNHVVDQLFDLALQVDAHVDLDAPVVLGARGTQREGGRLRGRLHQEQGPAAGVFGAADLFTGVVAWSHEAVAGSSCLISGGMGWMSSPVTGTWM